MEQWRIHTELLLLCWREIATNPTVRRPQQVIYSGWIETEAVVTSGHE